MAITLRNTKGIALTHNELDGNFIDLNDRTTCLESCASNSITSTQIDNWDCAYGWGNHACAGYCTTETSHADVVVDGDFTSAGLMTTDGNGVYNITTNNSSNWDTAYGWGDHACAGYLTSETDSQTLCLVGTDLSISNGNTVDLCGIGGTSYTDSDVATYLNGNLDTSVIPDTNAAYDLGTAEYKIRHLFLSDNSLKFTDTTDPLNIVEYSVGRTGTDITFNGSALKSTSTEDVVDAATIDITKTNHFVTNGTTAVLPDGTYIGQTLEFWRVAGTGVVDINVNSAIYMDGVNAATGPGPIVWRLGDANQTHYSSIWNGVAWVLSHGGPAV